MSPIIFACAQCDQPTRHTDDCPYAIFGPDVDSNMAVGRLDAESQAFADAARQRAEEREREARAAVVARLPSVLRWTVDHPSLLRAVYRVRPALRPTLTERR